MKHSLFLFAIAQVFIWQAAQSKKNNLPTVALPLTLTLNQLKQTFTQQMTGSHKNAFIQNLAQELEMQPNINESQFSLSDLWDQMQKKAQAQAINQTNNQIQMQIASDKAVIAQIQAQLETDQTNYQNNLQEKTKIEAKIANFNQKNISKIQTIQETQKALTSVYVYYLSGFNQSNPSISSCIEQAFMRHGYTLDPMTKNAIELDEQSLSEEMELTPDPKIRSDIKACFKAQTTYNQIWSQSQAQIEALSQTSEVYNTQYNDINTKLTNDINAIQNDQSQLQAAQAQLVADQSKLSDESYAQQNTQQIMQNMLNQAINQAITQTNEDVRAQQNLSNMEISQEEFWGNNSSVMAQQEKKKYTKRNKLLAKSLGTTPDKVMQMLNKPGHFLSYDQQQNILLLFYNMPTFPSFYSLEQIQQAKQNESLCEHRYVLLPQGGLVRILCRTTLPPLSKILYNTKLKKYELFTTNTEGQPLHQYGLKLKKDKTSALSGAMHHCDSHNLCTYTFAFDNTGYDSPPLSQMALLSIQALDAGDIQTHIDEKELARALGTTTERIKHNLHNPPIQGILQLDKASVGDAFNMEGALVHVEPCPSFSIQNTSSLHKDSHQICYAQKDALSYEIVPTTEGKCPSEKNGHSVSMVNLLGVYDIPPASSEKANYAYLLENNQGKKTVCVHVLNNPKSK